jgi:ribosome-associated protein
LLRPIFQRYLFWELNIENEELLKLAISAAQEIKPGTLVLLNLRGISSYTDRFLICSAASERQVHAIADRIEERLASKKVRPHHREGYEEAKWILLDYGDLIIHVFDQETKDYYDLERLWRDAPRTRILPSEDPASPQEESEAAKFPPGP